MADIPEFPDELLPTIELYLQNRFSEISKALQVFIDSATVFIDRFNALSDEEKAKREHLHEAIQGLSYVTEDILPEDGVLQLPINEMPVYAQKLQETLPIIVGIKIIWVFDALLAHFEE